MKSTNTMGLSILAGGLAFAGSANAVDLLGNGSFESTGDWVGHFQTYNYSFTYYAGPPVPASENPGDNYSWRHGVASGDYSGPLRQSVTLTPSISGADIDAGRGVFAFSAWMASYTANPERPYVTLQFFDASGTTQLGATIALDRTSGLGFVTFADGTNIFDRTTHEHHWAKYLRNGSIPSGARSARVGVTRSPNAGLSGNPDTYTDLVKLDVQTVAFNPPSIDSAQPSGGNTRPDAILNIALTDGTTQVDTNSVQLSLDGELVTPSIVKAGSTTTIQYDPPGLLAPDSAHTYRLVFSDNGLVPTAQTNDFTFSVRNYYHILLPAPLHFENFDAVAEGSLPSGWTSLNFSGPADPTCDPLAPDIGGLQDLNSACYANWTVVNSARFNDPMLTYSGHTPDTDYRRVLTPNFGNVVNGAVIANLAQTNIAFGDSGYREGGSQIVYLFSEDFDLTGQDSIYLSFHSIWEQNQDSMAAVEYSIDEGVTWLPIAYYLDPDDIIRAGDGSIDASATLILHRDDAATYIDPVEGLKGGYYGAFIGVDSNLWSTLGPFISPRIDDDAADGKRVEVFHLPAANNQPKVRLRFAHAGANSWYFGIDNVGFYRLTSVTPPLVSLTPAAPVEYLGNTVVFSASAAGIGPFTYQWQHEGVNLTGETNPTIAIAALNQSAAGTYTMRITFPGGVVSRSVELTLLDPQVAAVTGQWDFENYDMVAT